MWFKRMNKRNLISTIVGVIILVVISVFSTKSFELPKILSLIFIYSIAALALNIVCGCLPFRARYRIRQNSFFPA